MISCIKPKWLMCKLFVGILVPMTRHQSSFVNEAPPLSILLYRQVTGHFDSKRPLLIKVKVYVNTLLEA